VLAKPKFKKALLGARLGVLSAGRRGAASPMGIGGGIDDVPPDPEPQCMREGVALLDPLPCGLLVLPPPLLLSSPFPCGTAAMTLARAA
jgi:hypothetical protein